MKVSVIIPVYNGSRYLAAMLDSVLAQTYPLHEIIVIDDGSTDDSPTILRSYGDRLSVTRQANQGVAAARNAGLRHASGDVITFIDQDDLWPARRTEAMIDALRANPDALVATGPVEMLYERSQPPSPASNLETTLREFLVGSLCIRKEVFDLLGPFNTGLGYADDTDFLLRRREANIKTVYIEDVALQYRVHESNTSSDRELTNSYFIGALRESLRRRRKKEDRRRDDHS